MNRPALRLQSLTLGLGLAVLTTACASVPTPEPTPPERSPHRVIAAAGSFRPAVTTHRLDNGLEVHFLPDASAPLVSVQVWVKVGSVDENEAAPGDLYGTTGLSHFFEHLMFQGTERYPNYDLALAPLGAKNNAFTFHDATVYWAYTPKEHLRTILDIEADRFAHMKVDFIHLEPEREVVKSERRQRVDADPAELAEERAVRNSFDRFPYRWGPIGWMRDLDSVPLETAQLYHARHYRPDNAFLVIAGDFDPETTLAWITELWGPLKRTAVPTTFAQRSEVQAITESWTGPRSDHLFLQSAQTSVVWSYRAPAPSGTTTRDYAALELIDWALTGGKSGRLAKRLMYADTPKVSSLGASLTPLRFPYAYVWRADLLPGVTVHEIESALDEETARIATEGLPADELAEAVASLRSDLIRQNLSNSDKGESIGFAISSTGSPLAFHERLELFARLTSDDLAAAARRWLVESQRSRVVVISPDRLVELVTLAAHDSPFAPLAQTSAEIFKATLELQARRDELERERRAIALLKQRADLAMRSASAAEKTAITKYMRDNEMGDVKRKARATLQDKELTTASRELEAARKAHLATLKEVSKGPAPDTATPALMRLSEILALPIAADLTIPAPPTTLPAGRDGAFALAMQTSIAFALEARGLHKSAQAVREWVMTNAVAVLADAAPTEPVSATDHLTVIASALDLARDASVANLPLADRPISTLRPTNGGPQ